MATKEMVITTCDSCGKEEQYTYSKKKGVYIPRGWVHLVLNDYSHTILAKDLCPKCSGTILEYANRVEKSGNE